MAKDFQYKIQAEAFGYKDSVLTGSDIHNAWNVFHKNPDDKGLWALSTEGYLQITSNQNGLSGRYDPAHLTATDYGFLTEAIPSGVDDDSFGIHFRYQDNFHFYFVAWDGGGEYGWGTKTLRLYKVEGDVYQLLASSEELGHWVGGTKYQFEIEATGNHFIIRVDGIERINHIDSNNPYLTGAYGPCATSQVTTWTKIAYRGQTPFTLEDTFNGTVSNTQDSYVTGAALSTQTVKEMFQAALDAYLVANGGTAGAGGFTKFIINDLEDSVETYFHPLTPLNTTTDSNAIPYGYMVYAEEPPAPPENMVGNAAPTSITWTWVDASNNENGFEVLDELGNTIAVVGKGITQWVEMNIAPDTTLTRSVRSYNQWGVSASVSATARTENIAIITTPDAPKNLRGMANGTDSISWYWDAVKGAESYTLWDAAGNEIITTVSLRFDETGLTPDTQYARYVTAYNVAGASSPSNTAIAFTDALPVAGDVPAAPMNLTAEVIGDNLIVWRWEVPQIVIDPYYPDGVTEKTPEEIQAETEAALADISYRVYDANGEVLYEALPGVYEFREGNLMPDTSYTHFVKAFNKFGEGPRSNYAYARTEALWTGTPEVVEEPEWPIQLDCEVHEKEPQEKLAAMHSGIGDNLDLKVRVNKKGTPREQFTYDLQLKGYEYIPIEVYPGQDFKFRFKAEGLESLFVWTGDYIGKIKVYPHKSYRYKVDAYIATSVGFSYRAKANARVTTWTQNPVPFSHRGFANILYKKDTPVSTASMFNDATTAARWGPNTWSYDAATDTVRGLQNVNWSGAYNKNHLSLTDYSFEARLGVMEGGGDNDSIGLAFRIQQNTDGTMRYYYVMFDREPDYGQTIGGLKLGKIKNGPTATWTWPFGGTTLHTLRSTGWTDNVWYHFKVEVSGARIRIWLDGDLLCDIVDNDTDMTKGAFGPTNFSQIGCSFKDFRMVQVVPDTVYTDWRGDTITDVHNTAVNTKTLTTTALSTELQPKIDTAYANYKAKPGNESAVLEIIDYKAEDSRQEVVVLTNSNGTEGLKAYTTATTNTPSYQDMSIDSDTFTDSITDVNHSATTKKELTQTVSGVTKVHTVQEMLQYHIQDYKANNGIADADFLVQSYSVSSLTGGVYVSTDQTNGTDITRAYTSLGTTYNGSKEYSGKVYAYEGWKDNPEEARLIPLYNKYSEEYTGSTNDVTYTLTNLLTDTTMQVAWKSSGVSGARKGSDVHKFRTTAFIEKDISGVADGQNPSFYFIDDLIAIPSTAEYNAAHISIAKIGGHDNTFFYFRTNESVITNGPEIINDRRKDVLVISATERVVQKNWTSYSEWYDGSVNGVEPYKKNGDGKKDLRVPVEVIVPDHVEANAWNVEVDDPTGNVRWVLENGVGNRTTKKDDILIFWSDITGNDTAKLTWYGPKITGETIYEVNEGQVLEIKDRFLSPYRDPLLSTKNITEWKLIITSKNPNVMIKEAAIQEPWNMTDLFQSVNLEAKLINPTQTAWNPLIHDGYYYFNQKEFFLFADTKVKGKYMQSQGFAPVEFPYTVKVFAERVTAAGIQYWVDTNRSDFRGNVTNIDLDSQGGDIILAKTNGLYEQTGSYLSETKTFNGDIVDEWKEITWNANTPFNSTVKVETSVMEAGSWSPWLEAQNGLVIASPLSDKLRYRVTLTVGEEKSTKDFSAVATLNAHFNAGSHQNTVAANDSLKMNTSFDTGEWSSPVYDLGVNIDTLGTITYKDLLTGLPGEKLEVYTVTSDLATGPWDGTGEPLVLLNNVVTNADGSKTGNILSAKKRYLRYKVRFARGKEDSILTATITSSTDFSKGQLSNIVVGASDISLSKTRRDGTFVSDALDMGNVTSFGSLTVDAIIPTGGAVELHTLSANQVTDFDALESANSWLPLGATGVIQSAPAKYLKIKAVLKPGSSNTAVKAVSHELNADFASTKRSNVAVANDKIALFNPRYTGYYESEALDFTVVKNWMELTNVHLLNGGTLTFKTSTSDSALGAWTAWETIGAAGEILSPVNDFIRYRIDFTAGSQGIASVYMDDSQAKFQDTAVVTNATFDVTHTRISNTNPDEEMTYLSGLKSLEDLVSYGSLRHISTLAKDAVLSIQTRTSSDNVNWSAWQEIGAAGEILSPVRRHMNYKIAVTPGYGDATMKNRIDDTQTAFQLGITNNVQTLETGISLVDLKTQGIYYSSIWDLNGRVSAWDGVGVAMTLPVLEGSAKVFTLTADRQVDLEGTDELPIESLPWQEAIYDSITGLYTVASEPKRFIRYKVEMLSGFGEVATDVFTNTEIVTMTDKDTPYEYVSNAIHFPSMYDKWEGATNYDVQYVDNGGIIELYMVTAATEAELSTATEVYLGSSTDLTLSGTLTDVLDYMQYKIRMTASTEPSVQELPVVDAVSITSNIRQASSPEVSYVEMKTAATGFEPYKASEIGNIEWDFTYTSYSSPEVDSVTVSAETYSNLSPKVDALHANANVYYWKSATLEEAEVKSKLYDVVYHTPTVHEVSFGAKLPDQVISEEYGVSLQGIVPSDQATHQVSEKTMEQIIDDYMMEYGINQKNLIRTRYSITSGVPGIFVETKDNAAVYYENGQSEVFARTTDIATESIFSQAKVTVDANDEALVTPAPQQGAPLIVKDASGTELHHVTFLDANGNLTLTNTEYLVSDGTREFFLDYEDIDLATLELWVDESKTNVYTKIEDYITCNNAVHTKHVYDKGIKLKASYKLKNSYYVDYNYNVKEGYAMIKMHNPVLTDSREISVRYETSLNTAYYSAQEIDLNPMQNLKNEGFLYITDVVEPATQLEIRLNPNTLKANGQDRTTIIVVAKDKLGNPVVGDVINFFVTDGELIVNQPVTDINGMAIATFKAGFAPSDVELTVYDRTAVIESRKTIYLRNAEAEPRMTVNVSSPLINPDGVDRVRITARVVDKDQQPSVETFVEFSSPEGILMEANDTTNYIGEAYARIQSNHVPADGIITVKVYVPSLELTEYVNIRVNEVAPIV